MLRLQANWRCNANLVHRHFRLATRAHSDLSSPDLAVPPSARPSKASSKRKAEHLKSLAKELCTLGPKQLKGISSILEPDQLEAISTAKGIDATNQGRRRQVGFIGKLLASLSDEQQQDLDNQLNLMRKKADRT